MPFNHRIQAHVNGRDLMLENGEPFFWLGDTTWELFHRLTRAEITHLIQTRQRQGFNLLQAVALAELDGVRTPNREGHLPLKDLNPATPDLDGDYWDLVDFTFEIAERSNIAIALLPTWGDKFNRQWGEGPEIFTAENARQYGAFLGGRYGHRKNLVWVLGGDRVLDAGHLEIIRAMVKGIKSTEAEPHLMSFHPVGGKSSTDFVLGESWMDLHMMQSGHWWFDLRADLMIEQDRVRAPQTPTLDGEPCYENHRAFKAFGEYKDLSIPPLNDYHVRRATYASVLAGGAGVTYGCHAVWQMAQPGYEPINYPIGTWDQSLELPGANQMRYLKALALAFPDFSRIPDQSLIVDGLGEGVETARAARSEAGDFAAIYIPSPRVIKINTDSLTMRWRAFWLNPRTGDSGSAELVDGGYKTPTAQDWVLVFQPG